jgi:hypothetical protein
MKFFINKKKEKLKKYLDQIYLNDQSWSVISWNLNFVNESERGLLIEHFIDSLKLRVLYRFNPIDLKSVEWEENFTKKINASGLEGRELADSLNLVIHGLVASALEFNKSFVMRAVPGATTLDLQMELKALEWIKTSFKVLSMALDKIKSDTTLILTGAIFFGIEPQSQKRILRILAMNLDIFYYFEEDDSLRVVIFNDKNQGHGSSQEPAFHQIIKVTKPQFYDEIIKLINKFAVAGELSC